MCSKGISFVADGDVVDVAKSVGLLQIAALVIEHALKSLEASSDCTSSTTSYRFLSDRLD